MPGLGANVANALPTAGSISVKISFPQYGKIIAVLKATEAGWTSHAEGLHRPGGDVTFSRFVGPDASDPEIQAPLLEALKQAFADNYLTVSGLVAVPVNGGDTNPLLATARLIVAPSPEVGAKLVNKPWLPGEDGSRFVGTCFALRQTNAFLTAAHCTSDENMFIVMPGLLPKLHKVSRVIRHPSADLAVLRLDDDAWPPVDPFLVVAPAPPMGTEFMAYGFPEDAPAPNQDRPEPIQRLFRGYIQRGLQYERGSYKYAAVEMSVPCPAGLSGGPLFAADSHAQVIGLATENVESMTYVGRSEEVVAGAITSRTQEIHRVQYGIAVLLAPVSDWLD